MRCTCTLKLTNVHHLVLFNNNYEGYKTYTWHYRSLHVKSRVEN